MTLLAAATPFFVPLLLMPHLLFYYDITPKVAALMLAAALGLALAARELDSLVAFWRTWWGRCYSVAAGVSMLITGIAAVHSAERDLSWNGSNWRRMGVLTEWAALLAAFWIAQYATRSQSRLLVLLRSICAAGLLASLYGIAQYFGWDPILPANAYEAGEGIFRIVRPPGTLGHSDYFAAFLLWPIFAGVALSVVERSAGWRLLAIAVAVTGPVAILLSGSRGALLGLAGGALVRFALARPKSRVLPVALAAAVLALAGLYLSPSGARLRARVHWVTDEPTGGARLLLWRDSLKMASEKLLLGAGPDAFVAEFPKFQSVELARQYPDFYHESPHNMLLDTLTGEGLLGVLSILAIAVIGIAGGIRARQSNPVLSLAFLPGIVACLIVHQFTVFIAPTLFYFYLGAGVLAGARSEDPAPSTIPAFWRWPVFAGGLAAAALFGLVAYRLVGEDKALALVQRRLDSGDANGAAEAYRRALSLPTAGVTADLYLSQRWSQVAMSSSAAMPRIYYSQVAAGAASRATSQPEQLQGAWYNMSVLSAARNDAAGAEYSLRAAAAVAPNWYKPHWMLARILASEGRGAEAALEANRALTLNGGKDAEVSSTLAQILRSAAPQP